LGLKRGAGGSRGAPPFGRTAAANSFGIGRTRPAVAGPPSERLRAMGLSLAAPPSPVGSYAPVVVEGGFAWVSGQIVASGGKATPAGAVDAAVSVESAKAAARRATLQALSALAASLGSIDRIRRVVRVAVYVAVSPGFARPQEVANGATDLLIELFGESGRPARVAMGVAALPLDAPVEVEMTVAVG
jgi:enamine deaminase RidA (YjgF/YER057c/UK114 family)